VKELFPEIVVERQTTYLNDAQVTAVKKACEKNFAATTDLEMIEQGARFAAWALAKLKEQEAELAIAKPKAEVYEQISDASGLKSLQEVAKILGYGPKQFFKKLRDEHILYMDNGVNLPYQEFIDNGIFVVREEPYVAGGESRVYSRIFVTGKGELWLTRKIGREV
jgi:phage antirepressor YoqD-like protein